MVKNECTFQSVSRLWRVASRMPSGNTRRGVQGWPDEKKYQRRASAPSVSKMSNGAMTLPFDFDIFWPCSSTIRARHTTFR